MTRQITKWIGSIFLLYAIGVQLDLLLIGHYESFWQYLPILSLPLAVMLAVAYWLSYSPFLQRGMQVLALILCLMGLLGIYFHLQSNFQFEKEMRPSLSGLELWTESLTGALPALAPASLIPLGLLYYVISEITVENENEI